MHTFCKKIKKNGKELRIRSYTYNLQNDKRHRTVVHAVHFRRITARCI